MFLLKDTFDPGSDFMAAWTGRFVKVDDSKSHQSLCRPLLGFAAEARVSSIFSPYQQFVLDLPWCSSSWQTTILLSELEQRVGSI
jgi:hypothetical protein